MACMPVKHMPTRQKTSMCVLVWPACCTQTAGMRGRNMRAFPWACGIHRSVLNMLRAAKHCRTVSASRQNIACGHAGQSKACIGHRPASTRVVRAVAAPRCDCAHTSEQSERQLLTRAYRNLSSDDADGWRAAVARQLARRPSGAGHATSHRAQCEPGPCRVWPPLATVRSPAAK